MFGQCQNGGIQVEATNRAMSVEEAQKQTVVAQQQLNTAELRLKKRDKEFRFYGKWILAAVLLIGGSTGLFFGAGIPCPSLLILGGCALILDDKSWQRLQSIKDHLREFGINFAESLKTNNRNAAEAEMVPPSATQFTQNGRVQRPNGMNR